MHMTDTMILLFAFGVLSSIPKIITEKKSCTYGGLNAQWYNFSICRGPKAKNLYDDLTIQYDDVHCILYMNVTFSIDVFAEEVHMKINKIEGKKKILLWNYKSDPCHHFIFAELIKKQYNISDCHISKGFYPLKFNLAFMANYLLGSVFTNGEYLVHSYSHTKQGNLLCIDNSIVVYN